MNNNLIVYLLTGFLGFLLMTPDIHKRFGFSVVKTAMSGVLFILVWPCIILYAVVISVNKGE